MKHSFPEEKVIGRQTYYVQLPKIETQTNHAIFCNGASCMRSLSFLVFSTCVV
jgi:hypothetical protein